MSSSIASPTQQRGFSLVELLVTIAIIAVLLAITLPAIRGAQRSARFSQCTVSMRSVLDTSTVFAQDHNRARWANAFEPGTGIRTWTYGDTTWVSANTIDQTDQWTGHLVLEGFLDRFMKGLAGQGCPEIIRRLSQPDINPQGQLHLSYHYSAALFTAPELWESNHPDRRDRPDDYRRSIGLHEVLFPSKLVAYFETGDHHGSGRYFHEFSAPGEGRSLVAFCDGHVSNEDPYQTATLALPWEMRSTPTIPFRGAMPFNATPGGCRGQSVP